MMRRRLSPNSYWGYHGDVGIRTFPRAGSSTMAAMFGRNGDLGEFLACPKKVCIVRDPWERLMSVFYGMARTEERFGSYSFPKGKSLNDFLAWLVEQNPYDLDAHLTPYYAFLEGYWRPEDDGNPFMLLNDFLNNPPYGLKKPKVHINKTDYPKQREVASDELYSLWYERFGCEDYRFVRLAQKSPLVTGGKSTDE